MKTIEEKAKAYDDALKWMRELYPGLHGAIKEDAEHHFPELAESEDERIRKGLIQHLKELRDWKVGTMSPIKASSHYDAWIAYLEKQKEPKPNPLCGSTEEYYREAYYADQPKKEQKPIEFKNDELVEIIKGEFEGFRRLLKKKGIDYEPQRGYWEGFARLFDSSAREYVKEQKPAEKQDYSGLNDLERAIHRGFLCAGVENVPVTIIKETAQDCMSRIKPAEWSEEDEKNMATMIEILNLYQRFYDGGIITSIDDRGGFLKRMIELSNWLKSLRPQPKRVWRRFLWHPTMQFDYTSIVKYDGSDEYEIVKAGNKPTREMNGVFIPIKEISTQPHWKPSEEQINTIGLAIQVLNSSGHNSLCCKLNALRDNLLKLK